jgi:hypothetical protein
MPRLVREHRLYDAPFVVGEFVPHDSMLHFRSLNHAQDHNINRQPARLLSKGERPIADMAELPLVTRCIDCTNEQIRYHETHAQS